MQSFFKAIKPKLRQEIPQNEAYSGSVGILAYGSLIDDPGVEIDVLVVHRIPTQTPFGVEYARLSGFRAGAPTVVPHPKGGAVKAEILVLQSHIGLTEAMDLLWRRETRNEATGRHYVESPSQNAVVVRDQTKFCGVGHVLYTDFNQAGKLDNPNPKELAHAAINSVALAPPGLDGLSYLINNLNNHINTPLTKHYVRYVLLESGASNLQEAFTKSRT
jgi:hypothetical protein